MIEATDGRLQPMLGNCLDFLFTDRGTEEENRRLNPSLPQLDPLFKRGHRKPRGTGRERRPGDRNGAMAVAISLDDRHELRRRSQQPSDRLHISSDRPEIDLYPGAAGRGNPIGCPAETLMVAH